MTVMATVTDLRQDEGRAACASVSALRVLYLFPDRPEGSAMIFAKKQVEAMGTLGVAAEAFCLESRTDLSGLRRDASRLRDVIASFRPDLLHAQYGTMTAFFATVAANVPMVVTFRGSDLNPAPSDPWLRSLAGRLLSHLAARRAAGLICVSEQLKRRLWWGRERALVLPSGVDIELFQPHPQAEARRELGWSQEERIVLFNAGLSPMVKREDLAQAAVLEAERLCGRITVVRLDGFVPQRRVVAMMNGADCLLLTSDWEGSPTIVQEALACNLPVVSVDVGDVRERLLGVTPSVIAERSPSALAQGLCEVLRRRSRSNGRTAAMPVAQVRIAEQTVALYREVLTRLVRGGAAC